MTQHMWLERQGLLVAFTFAVIGCHSNMTPNQYRAVVRSGFSKIPESLEMERLYGRCDHFIGFSSARDTQTWNTEVIVEGRYELTMQCEITVSRSGDNIDKVVSEPQFFVREIERIIEMPDGRAAARYSEKNQTSFGVDGWRKVVDSDGDLSNAGIAFVRQRPVKNVMKYGEQMSAPRLAVRPSVKE